MNKLLELFQKREAGYEKATEAILKEIPNVLEGAASVLDYDAGQRVEWKEAQLGNSGILSVVGMITYDIGETVITSLGEIVEVTEENQQEMVRLIRVGIPIEIALNGTAEQIKDFLKETKSEKAGELHSEGDIDAMADFLEEILDEQQHDVDVEGRTIYIGDDDFDFDQLTDDQIDSMYYNEKTSKGKVH